MLDLADVTADAFEPHVGDAFLRTIDGHQPIELRLVAVERGSAPTGWRPPFSLELTGPTSPVLAPDTHPLDHAVLGRLEVFISPVMVLDAPADRTTYQVVFG